MPKQALKTSKDCTKHRPLVWHGQETKTQTQGHCQKGQTAIEPRRPVQITQKRKQNYSATKLSTMNAPFQPFQAKGIGVLLATSSSSTENGIYRTYTHQHSLLLALLRVPLRRRTCRSKHTTVQPQSKALCTVLAMLGLSHLQMQTCSCSKGGTKYCTAE